MLPTLIWLLSHWNQHSSLCKTEPYSLEQYDFGWDSYRLCWSIQYAGIVVGNLLQQDKGSKSREMLKEEFFPGTELPRTKNG